MRLRWPAVAVLALLTVHSLTYGVGFVVDPAQGAREFGESEPPSQTAKNLTGLVGVLLVLLGGASAVAAVGVARSDRSAAKLTFGLGIATGSVAVHWGSAGSAWDAGFYGTIGLALLVMGGALIRGLQGSERSGP